MSDINEAMGISPATPPPAPVDTPKKPKPKRTASSRPKPLPPTAEEAAPPRTVKLSRIRQGQRCPKCERGLIGVIRTRLYRVKNKRVVILGCRNQSCFWDLDGDNERVTPINAGRPVDA